MLTHPKSNYSNDYISAHRWCCPLKFSHVRQNGQSLLNHTYRGRGSTQQFFTMINSKIRPTFSICAPITLGPGDQPHQTFPGDVPRGRHDNVGTLFGGTASLRIWEGENGPKFGAILGNFTLWSQISPERIKTSTCEAELTEVGRLYGCWRSNVTAGGWNAVGVAGVVGVWLGYATRGVPYVSCSW